jgi:fructoselysine 6-kinase
LDRNRVYPGGNAVNVAVYTRRLGARSWYVGTLGDDFAGDLMHAALVAEGVDVTHVRRVAGRSGYATVRSIGGDRVFQGGSKGVVEFQLSQQDLDLMADAAMVHTGDSSFLEDQLALIAAVAPVSFDFSIRPLDYCAPLVGYTTMAAFSLPGASRQEVFERIDWAHGLGAKIVAVTQGMDGSFLSDSEHVHHQAAVTVESLDPLGAGDSYIAGVMVNLAQGKSLEQAALGAAQFAAQTCLDYGAFGHGAPADQMTLAPDHEYH